MYRQLALFLKLGEGKEDRRHSNGSQARSEAAQDATAGSKKTVSSLPMPGVTPGGFVGCVSSSRPTLIVPQGTIHAGYQVAFRGYIANRPDLLLDLEARPDASNASLVALACRRYGVRAVLQLQGEFAAVVVDDIGGEAFIIHDALGLCPVFYASSASRLLFTTHLADLAGLITSEELDAEYLADFLAYGQPTGERTPFKSIRRLLPGELLRWSPGGARRVAIWSAAAVNTPIPVTEQEQEEQFLHLLHRAVRGAGTGPGVAWTELSGGLDSSTVTCIAAQQGFPQLAAVSVVYPRWESANERECMRTVTEHLQIPLHELDGCTHMPFAAPVGDFIGEPSPLAFTGSLSQARDRLLHEQGVSLLLTGMGGDEVMGGNPGLPYHLSDSLFDGHAATAFKNVLRWSRSGSRSLGYTFWSLVLRPALRHLRGLQVWEVPSHHLPDWIDGLYRDAMNLRDRCSLRLAPRGRTPGRQFVADVYWLMAMTIANRGQREVRYDIRHPLLSRPLLEFMTCLSWEQKLRPESDRVLQRRALQGILPEAIRTRTTKGGGTWALVEGLRQSESWCELLTRAPHIVERGMADRERWSLAVRRARLGHTQSDRYLMAGISLESWFGQLAAVRKSARALSRSVAPEYEAFRTLQRSLYA